MHPEAYAFVEKALADFDLKRKHVLEFGSYNVNGSVRPLFAEATTYTGVDRRSGPGVDVVSVAQEVNLDTPVHVIVSTEAIEHDPDPEGLIAAAFRNLRPGGLLILTAAGPERAPHGNDGAAVRAGEHYANVEPADLRAWLKAAGFVEAKVTQNKDVGDVYAVATRPTGERAPAATTDKEN